MRMARRAVKNLGFQEFSSVEEFRRRWDPSSSGAISIEDKLPIHLHWTNKQAGNTVICFSAASSKVREVPFWTGRGLTSSLDANVLLVSDPSMILDRTLSLGWYAGSLEQPDLIETLTEVFRVVSQGTRPIFFGASAGGWAALKYAARLDEAVAVAVNPQVDIARYMYFPYYLRKAWHAEEGSERLPSDGNVARDYAEGNDSLVVYVQNEGDSHHLNEHFAAFKAMCGNPDKLIELLPDLGAGHVAPAKESLVQILETTIASKSASELRTNLAGVEIKSSGVNKEIKVSRSAALPAGAIDEKYPILFEQTYQLPPLTRACSVELSSSVELPEKAFAVEIHFDEAEMDKQLAKKLGLSWSDGLQSAFVYSQPVTPTRWNQHQDFQIPESATRVRIVLRKWSWNGAAEQPRVMLRLCSKSVATEVSL